MKRIYFFCIFISVFVTCCNSDKQTTSSDVPCIDVRKDYPEKEIILTDIANVSYVHLSTENDDYIYKGGINYVSDNTIVVFDNTSNSVLFFHKDGTPKSRFNRYGNGPQEYNKGGGFFEYVPINGLLYDEKADEVFMELSNHKKIQVYSSTGKYKRTIKRSSGSGYTFYDKQSLIASNLYTIFLISRTNGEILESIDLPIPVNIVDMSVSGVHNGITYTTTYYSWSMIKGVDGFYFSKPGVDTIYLLDKNKNMTPIMRQTPLARDLDPKIILDNSYDIGKYQFMTVHTLHVSNDKDFATYPEYPNRFYMRDKKTGEVFRQKIIIPDYKGKEIFFGRRFGRWVHEKKAYFRLNLYELKEAYHENRLSGKLKELVATLDEDIDNDVYMFVDFK